MPRVYNFLYEKKKEQYILQNKTNNIINFLRRKKNQKLQLLG